MLFFKTSLSYRALGCNKRIKCAVRYCSQPDSQKSFKKFLKYFFVFSGLHYGSHGHRRKSFSVFKKILIFPKNASMYYFLFLERTTAPAATIATPATAATPSTPVSGEPFSAPVVVAGASVASAAVSSAAGVSSTAAEVEP